LRPPAKQFVPLLRAGLKDEKTRYGTVCVLADLGPTARDVLPELRRLLPMGDLNMQRACAYVLWKVDRDKDAFTTFRTLMKNKKKDVRWNAITTIAILGADAKPFVPDLLVLLKDHSSTVRQAAASALKKIDPKAAAKAGVK
jgi:HEAT repeat protein